MERGLPDFLRFPRFFSIAELPTPYQSVHLTLHQGLFCLLIAPEHAFHVVNNVLVK